jgi:hypothetical protein
MRPLHAGVVFNIDPLWAFAPESRKEAEGYDADAVLGGDRQLPNAGLDGAALGRLAATSVASGWTKRVIVDS